MPQIQADTSGDTLSGNKATDVIGVNHPNDLLAYDKQNAYRVWGDVLRVSQDYQIGDITGQVRAGIWSKARAPIATNIISTPINAPPPAMPSICRTRQPRPRRPAPPRKAPTSFPAWAIPRTTNIQTGPSISPSLEVDIRPTENLLITPGVKYVHWDHSVNAPVEQGNTCGIDLACAPYNALGQNFVASFTTTDTLPFLQMNYRIEPSWSVYGEYAKGIYVPDISAFEGGTQTTAFPKAETTTNFQVGTVYYADHYTFDADIYYIPINNNYISQPCPGNVNDTCFINNGKATYQGIEGEGTYAFQNLFGMNAEGLSVFANGSVMRSVAQGGKWQPNAPFWTAAAGIYYQGGDWRFGLTDKYTGQQYSDTANNPLYKLPAYGNFNAMIAYDFSKYEVAVNVDNLFSSRAAVLITEGGTGSSPATSTDQYFFQGPMSVMVTLKAHL